MNITMNGAAASEAGLGSSEPPSSQGLGKDDFLNLLIAQLSNQNPLEPMEGAEFVAQLAQFSSVEQLAQINDGLELLAMGQAGMISGQSINMVGKTVRFPSVDVNLEEGKNVDFEYEINRPAVDVNVTIKDSQGRTVKTMELGPTGPGTDKVDWDGLDDDGDSLTDLWSPVAATQIHLAVFLGQSGDLGVGIFDYIPMATVRIRMVSVIGQCFTSGIDDNLIRYGVTDNCTDKLCCTIF